MDNKNYWMDGTQLLAAVLEKFSPGVPVRFTSADLEAMNFRTTHPVVFTIDTGSDSVEMAVVRPGDAMTPGPQILVGPGVDAWRARRDQE